MKRRINLLSVNFKKRELSEVVSGFRMKALIVCGILIVAGIVEFATFRYLERQKQNFNSSKGTLEQFLGNNEEFEQQLKYFIYKFNLLNTYLQDDANGYKYFSQVNKLLAESTVNSSLESFSYKNNGETTFTVTFNDYEAAAFFISQLETPLYLDTFEFIRLDGFDAIGDDPDSGFNVSIFAQFIFEDEN